MNFYVAWLIIGSLLGWVINRIVQGDSPPASATVLGIVGAFVGGWIGLTYSEPPNLTPTLIGAAAGATIFSVILAVYRLRRRRV